MAKRMSKKGKDAFDLDFGMPKIEIPEIEMPSLDFGLEQRKIDLSKIPKIELIGILSKQLST